MEKLFKWGKTTLALVPGLTVMFVNLWSPGEIPHLLLGGIMQAIGGFTLMIFHLSEPALKKQPPLRLIKLGTVFCTLFIVSLIIYIIIFYNQNVYNSKYDTAILIPFWKNDDLKYMISEAGSVSNAISNYGPDAIRDAIKKNEFGMSITKVLFIINYISIFEFLVIGFGFITGRSHKKPLSRKPSNQI